MEQHGIIILKKYTNEIDIPISKCIFKKDLLPLDNSLYTPYIKSLNNDSILVLPKDIPQWIIKELKNESIKENDKVIVFYEGYKTYKLINEEILIEFPQYSSTQLLSILKDFNDELTKSIVTITNRKTRENILNKIIDKYNL